MKKKAFTLYSNRMCNARCNVIDLFCGRWDRALVVAAVGFLLLSKTWYLCKRVLLLSCVKSSSAFFLFLTAYSNFMHTTFLCALQFRSFINQRIITTNGANKLTHIRKKITAIYCLSYCERLFSSISCRLQINHRIYSWFEWYVMSWL